MTGFVIGYVERKMEALARETGYCGTVHVNLLPALHNQIKAYNDVRTNRWRLKGWLKFLFGVTFLWVFALPYLKASTNKFGEVVAKRRFSRSAANGGPPGVRQHQRGSLVERLGLGHTRGRSGEEGDYHRLDQQMIT